MFQALLTLGTAAILKRFLALAIGLIFIGAVVSALIGFAAYGLFEYFAAGYARPEAAGLTALCLAGLLLVIIAIMLVVIRSIQRRMLQLMMIAKAPAAVAGVVAPTSKTGAAGLVAAAALAGYFLAKR